MPHVSIEYTAFALSGVDIATFLKAVEKAAVSTGTIPLSNLKLRAHKVDLYRVGGQEAEFIHVSVAMMQGPTLDERQAVSGALLVAISALCPNLKNITIDIREMTRETYSKRVNA